MSLIPLIQKPGSPDIAIKGGSQAASAPARISHVNALSVDINGAKFYEVDMNTSSIVKVCTKKGIIEVFNADSEATSLYIGIQSCQVTTDRESFYLQLTVYSTSYAITPIIIGRGISEDVFNIEIKNLDSAGDWGNLYFYYELIKVECCPKTVIPTTTSTTSTTTTSTTSSTTLEPPL